MDLRIPINDICWIHARRNWISHVSALGLKTLRCLTYKLSWKRSLERCSRLRKTPSLPNKTNFTECSFPHTRRPVTQTRIALEIEDITPVQSDNSPRSERCCQYWWRVDGWFLLVFLSSIFHYCGTLYRSLPWRKFIRSTTLFNNGASMLHQALRQHRPISKAIQLVCRRGTPLIILHLSIVPTNKVQFQKKFLIDMFSPTTVHMRVLLVL